MFVLDLIHKQYGSDIYKQVVHLLANKFKENNYV